MISADEARELTKANGYQLQLVISTVEKEIKETAAKGLNSVKILEGLASTVFTIGETPKATSTMESIAQTLREKGFNVSFEKGPLNLNNLNRKQSYGMVISW